MNATLAGWVDIVIAFTLVEVVALTVWWRFSGGGVAPRDFLLNVVSGLCLMLALRCALRQSGAEWTLLCLAAAGAAHGTDLRTRWRRVPAGTREGAVS